MSRVRAHASSEGINLHVSSEGINLHVSSEGTLVQPARRRSLVALTVSTEVSVVGCACVCEGKSRRRWMSLHVMACDCMSLHVICMSFYACSMPIRFF